jgi:hypothetical protein
MTTLNLLPKPIWQTMVTSRKSISGNAIRYNTPNLQTGAAISAANSYKSRMIVRRPTTPAKFNGVVIVEWVNVTSGYNYDLLWQALSDYFMREGYA